MQVRFTGRVQGVGFRYTVRECARELHLSGWVKNCQDGSVVMHVEGPADRHEILLNRISERFPGHIKERSVSCIPGPGMHTSFDIVH